MSSVLIFNWWYPDWRSILENIWRPYSWSTRSSILDRGYLFSQLIPIEKGVKNDTIDLEIKISEGEPATYNRVTFSGNDVTYDHVIARELRTKPGDLFSKTEIKKSSTKQSTTLDLSEHNAIHLMNTTKPAYEHVILHGGRPILRFLHQAAYGDWGLLLQTWNARFCIHRTTTHHLSHWLLSYRCSDGHPLLS